MNIATYQKLRYDINSRHGGVNCWTLYCKVIKDKFNIDVPVFFGLDNSKASIADEFNKRLSMPNGHAKVAEPKDFDLVIFKYTHASKKCFHCGVLINGKVLHANGSGVKGSVWYDRIKDIKHDSMEFYRHELI